MRTAECRGCGAPMVWARTGRGAKMPLDAEPSSAGTYVLENEDTSNPTTYRMIDPAYTGPRYTSHFQTCPKASDFSKKRGSGDVA